MTSTTNAPAVKEAPSRIYVWIGFFSILFADILASLTPLYAGETNPDSLYVTMPLLFTANVGQFAPEVLYSMEAGTASAVFTRDAVVFPLLKPKNYSMPGSEVGRVPLPAVLRFIHPSVKCRVRAEYQAQKKSHYYLSADKSKWFQNVPNYRQLRYANVWDGVDVVYNDHEGRLLQTFVIRDDEALSSIKLDIGKAPQEALAVREVRSATDKRPVDIHIEKQKNGTIAFSSPSPLPPGGLILCTEFLSPFGCPITKQGIQPDHLMLGGVDSEGSMYIAVMAECPEYPITIVPKELSQPDSGLHTMVTKIGCDNSVMYSTYLGSFHWIRDLKIGSDGSAYLLTHKGGVGEPPITFDAMFKHGVEGRSSLISHLGADGTLQYCSYLGPLYVRYQCWDLEFDTEGRPCILGMRGKAQVSDGWHPWLDNPPFTPWDTVSANRYQFPIDPGDDPRIRYGIADSKYFIIKLSKNCKEVVNGTMFPCTSTMDVLNGYGVGKARITIDNRNNLIILLPHKFGSICISGTLLPVHTSGSFNPVLNSLYIAKFDSAWQHIEWTDVIGGDEEGTYIGKDYEIITDSDANIHIHAPSESSNLPVTGYPALPAEKKSADYLLKLSPEGKILHAIRIGIYRDLQLYGDPIAVDKNNSLWISARYYADFMPETHSFSNVGVSPVNAYPWLILIDSSYSQIRYAARMPIGMLGGIHLDKQGYLYSAAGVDDMSHINAYWQLFPGYEGYEADSAGFIRSDFHLMRLKPPLETYPTLAYTLDLPDSIYIALRRGIITPKAFTITYMLENKWSEPLNNIDVTLDLPHGIQLDPPNQPVSFSLNPSSMLPNEKRIFQWTVVLDTIAIQSLSKLVINVRSNYDWASLTQHCPQPNACGKHIIPVIKEVEQEPDLACELVVLDTLQSIAGGTMYQDSVVSLRYTIQNNDNIPVYVASLELEFDPGMAIRVAPGYTKSVGCGWLQPGEYKTYSWDVIVSPRFAQREIGISIMAYDTVHYSVSVCTAHIAAPGVFGLTCSATGPEWITVTGNTYQPDSIILQLDITNHLDTAKGGSNALILLENTRLGLPAGETALKYRYLPPGVQRLQWTVVPEASTLTTKEDTVWFAYWSASDTVRHYCMHILQYNTLSPDAHCSINAPSTLAVDNYDYTPNPFDLDYTLENKGTAQLDIASIAITLLPDITTTDPLTVAVTPLAPNGKHDIQWNLKALTSAFKRNISIPVTAYDSESKPVAVCEHHLFLPAIMDMTCESQSTAHIVYNANDRRYEPNPVTASLVVYNHVDTVQNAIEAEIDLTTAPHLKLATGEQNPQTIATLAANMSHQFDWKLDVLPADSQVTETITMRYRSAAHQEWRGCSWIYAIDEEAKTYSATCIAGGVDSLWLNGTAELIIPNPFQVYYTITNTGTGMLTNCNGTIHLPNHLQLMTGEQPAKYYGNIEPGISVQRAWMVGADPSVQSLGTHDVTFSFTANNLTTDVPCDHTVIISQRDQIDLALSHKNLYFIAKKDAALPASQQIMVYSGSPTSMPWTAQGCPSWLNVQPSNGNTQSVDIQPNTTAMNYGTYTGSVDFSSSAPNSPKALNVIYDIVETVGLPEVPAINGVTLYQNYPNPFSELTSISFNVESRMQVTLSVYNTLGDLISTQSVAAQPEMNTVTVSNLQPGLYMYVLATPNGAVSRRMVRR